MATLFGILNVGARGLAAAQSALNTTGHNIANTSTEGYSRQRIVQGASPPIATAQGIFGTGVDIITVERIRDTFLDNQVRNAKSGSAFYEELDNVFSRIEAILNETLSPVSDSTEEQRSGGLNSILSYFYSAWHQLANSPEAPESRIAVIEAGRTLAESLNLAADGLDMLRSDLNDRAIDLVNEINRLASSIAALNRRIVLTEADPTHQANDLRDERDRLLDRLSEIVPTTVLDLGEDQVAVTVLGTRLVDGTETNLLQTKSAGGQPVAVDQISFQRQGLQSLDRFLRDGRLGGALDARDRIIPSLSDQVDQLARSVIQEVNRIHSAATGLTGHRTLTSSFSFPSGSHEPDSTRTLQNVFNEPVQVPDAPSSSQPFSVTDGEITVRVATQANQTRGTFSVNVRLSDNLNDIVERIDRADGIVSVARSAAEFDPIFFSDARSALSFDPADVTGTAAQPLSALFLGVPVGFEPGPFQLDIYIKDSTGKLVDSNTSTTAMDPFTVTINPTDTLSDVATAISTATGGRAAADFVTDPDDPSKVKFRIRAAQGGETLSVRGDTSGIIRAMHVPITDPTLDPVGGVASQATGTFAAGEENTDFITPGNPNFSPVFPGPPPSVIGEGSFDVIVVDARGNVRATQNISIADGGNETISLVAAQLNSLADLNVTVTADGELEIEAINDSRFFFRNDTTGLLRALGLDQINGHGELNGLPFQSGTFEIVVANDRGTVTDIFSVEINADPATGVMSLSDIVQAINDSSSAVGAPVFASLVPSPRDSSNRYVLQIEATGGHQFTFRSDDTLLLAALGFTDGPVLSKTGDNPIMAGSSVTRVGEDIGPTVSAGWDTEGNIVINSTGTDEISFLEDTSHFLASAGINTFFQGWDARSIQVTQEIAADHRLLAASRTGAPGDNQAALAVAALRDSAVLEGGSHGDYYRSVLSQLGTEAAKSRQFFDVNQKLLEEFKALREEISGVSLDEESINLIRFQQAFQASARLISTLDQLLATVIGLGL